VKAMIEGINEKCEESCTGSLTKTVQQIKESMKNEDDFLSIAEVFKALGDPTRVKIIYALSQGELCVHDLTEILDMTQSAISHQLRYLRNLRVVKRRKAGKTVFYSLDDHHIEQIFTQTLNHVEHR
jgi:DNA-binding transcriptional ArsR family regulator